ncbi:MAG: type VI secretion system Vgr family protein [Planctomycetota bacterium]
MNTRELGVVLSRRADDFVLLELTAREELSRPFRFVVELASEDPDVALDEMIGETLAAWLLVASDEQRWFHGRITRFTFLGYRGNYARYEAVVEPEIAILDRNRDCRIFQDLTAPEVVKEVLRNAGVTDLEDRLTDDYPQRSYCVQYRESDFAFLSRLLEEEGITYWFEHRADRHVMVLGDAGSAHEESTGYESVRFRPPTENLVVSDVIDDWRIETDLRPGTYEHEDFDFKRPKSDLLARRRPADRPANGSESLVVYEWPGDYNKHEDGDRYARLRIEEIHAEREVARGSGGVRGLRPGHTFRLTDYPRRDQNQEWLVIETQTRLVSDALETSGELERSDPICRTSFRAIDRERPFRPARRTPRPVIQGPQTAIVTGRKEGEEICTDQHGRVKVLFHWDRHCKSEATSSCWIRVTHPWAGNGWGGLAIPRVGQEVVVEFLEGDPDRPIVNGRLYNGDQKPPQELPAAQNSMSIRSQSLGGSGGSNEITMNDTPGAEGFYIHAQYDLNEVVENDRSCSVGNNETRAIAVDRTTEIGSNETLKIGANAQESVGANKLIDVGSTLTLRAGTSITLQCGASTLHMNQAGFITLSGTVINIAAAVNANMVAPVTNVVGAVMSTNTGAVNIVTGGVVARMVGSQVETVAECDNVVRGAKVKINT